MFHNWTYAGWVTSEKNNLPPKTIHGNWEALIPTIEFEQGLVILDKRNQKRTPNRKHDYLLRGLLYFYDVSSKGYIRLTCSTTNSSRANGGTAYYRIAGRNIRFLCHEIDTEISSKLDCIQVDAKHIPSIRSVYTNDIAQKIGHLQPNEQDRRKQLRHTLDSIQERQQDHIENLDSALEIISCVGIMYNELDRDDKRELLRLMVVEDHCRF